MNTRKMSLEENVNLAKRENKTHKEDVSRGDCLRGQAGKNTRKMSREKNVYLAELTKKTNRFEDMVDLVERILRMCVDDSEELTCKERELLSVAYRRVINSRLFSLRRISRMEQKEERLGNAKHVSTCKEYKGMIESDLTKKCYGILNLLNSQASSTVARVFYWGKKGDYFKCLAEFKTGSEREEALQCSLSAYKAAEDTRKMSREENVNLAKQENKNTRRMCNEGIVNLVKWAKKNTREMSREENVYMAKLAKKAERYEDMIDLMEKILKKCVDDSEELTRKERKLVSVFFERVINPGFILGERISRIEQEEERLGNANHVSIIKEYKGMIESELTKFLNSILCLLYAGASSPVAQVFYWRKKGDYFDCLAQFKTGTEREEALQRSLSAYDYAQDIVDANWPTPPSNFPPRIGPEPTTTFSEALEMIGTGSLLDVVFGEPFNLGEESHKDNTLGEESYKDHTSCPRENLDRL
ncbi:hypothetical protein OROGR_014098 [Orobanche gracilis]